MESGKEYPRILVVAMGRINASDSYNNGLLLRNLFEEWPKDNIAQIYSGGNNNDRGYFGSYYCLGKKDRRFGSLFIKVKGACEKNEDICLDNTQSRYNNSISNVKEKIKTLFVDTGLYELIFIPKISREMMVWIEEFKPDIIFAQGYNLTFSWLPLKLKKMLGIKLSFFASDDWPLYLYSGFHGEPLMFRWLLKPIVKKITKKLLSEVDVPFAFGEPMANEYALRYKKKFFVLNHVDSFERFDRKEEKRCYSTDVITLLSIGNYNGFRWPLLLDVDEVCRGFNAQGIKIRLAVLSSNIDKEGKKALSEASYVDLYPDPGHDMLPSYLKGADILLLAEGFDNGYVSAIKLSVSSKAHLFMYSRKPIIVYSHPETGVAKYAEKMGWAKVVTRRNIKDLSEAIKEFIENKKEVDRYIERSQVVMRKYHTYENNHNALNDALNSCI